MTAASYVKDRRYVQALLLLSPGVSLKVVFHALTALKALYWM
jgi:hypothetical protein